MASGHEDDRTRRRHELGEQRGLLPRPQPGVEERLGGLSSPRLVMSTVDFAEVTALEDAERWDEVAALLADAARGVEAGGADFLLLCTTTFHRVADQVAAAVDIPLLHLADVVAEACKARGSSRSGFIGTTFAMSAAFFTDRMAAHGLEVLVPDEPRTTSAQPVIYEELVHGKVLDRLPAPGRRAHRRAVGRRRRAACCSAAPSSSCWSTRPTSTSRSSRAPRCTSRPRWTARWPEPSRGSPDVGAVPRTARRPDYPPSATRGPGRRAGAGRR